VDSLLSGIEDAVYAGIIEHLFVSR
jgi:hypothetical protein